MLGMSYCCTFCVSYNVKERQCQSMTAENVISRCFCNHWPQSASAWNKIPKVKIRAEKKSTIYAPGELLDGHLKARGETRTDAVEGGAQEVAGHLTEVRVVRSSKKSRNLETVMVGREE